jgi:hypothetical protein
VAFQPAPDSSTTGSGRSEGPLASETATSPPVRTSQPGRGDSANVCRPAKLLPPREHIGPSSVTVAVAASSRYPLGDSRSQFDGVSPGRCSMRWSIAVFAVSRNAWPSTQRMQYHSMLVPLPTPAGLAADGGSARVLAPGPGGLNAVGRPCEQVRASIRACRVRRAARSRQGHQPPRRAMTVR